MRERCWRRCRRPALRAELDLRNEKINYKVREHSLAKVPVLLVVGKREAEEGTVSVRRLGGESSSLCRSTRRSSCWWTRRSARPARGLPGSSLKLKDVFSARIVMHARAGIQQSRCLRANRARWLLDRSVEPAMTRVSV